MNFSDLPIENKLKNSIKFADFITPTPIQSKSIPVSLTGKDILGTAQTGTGKTLAFTIPMINRLIVDKNAMALIICPTRELASQVMQTVLKLNVREIGIGNALLIGGESMQKQLKKLKKRARIIVGTPGTAGAYTQITVASGAPTLYYYCTNHSGMGGQANTP